MPEQLPGQWSADRQPSTIRDGPERSKSETASLGASQGAWAPVGACQRVRGVRLPEAKDLFEFGFGQAGGIVGIEREFWEMAFCDSKPICQYLLSVSGL